MDCLAVNTKGAVMDGMHMDLCHGVENAIKHHHIFPTEKFGLY